MEQITLSNLQNGFNTAYIDKTYSSNLAYKPQFISNNYKEGRKVLSSIEDELLSCKEFFISVAFITTTTKKAARFSHPLRMSFCHVKNFLSA